MLVGVERLHHPLPRPHLVLVGGHDHGHGMKFQVLADVGVVEPRAAQQRRGVQRPAGGDDGARADGDPMAVERARLDASRGTAFDDDPLGARVDDEAGAGAAASTSQVLVTDCLAPIRQPRPQ